MRRPYPAEVTKDDIDKAIEAFAQSADPENEFGFAPSTDYDLVLSDGRRLPPKAIAGIATRRVLGRAMLPSEFSAGEGQACFRVLRENGFKVEPKPEGQETADQTEGWRDDELRAALGAYLEMLAHERAGRRYTKAKYIRRVREDLHNNRTIPAIEYRMADISKTLAEAGLPWIEGYKPLTDVGPGVQQRLLRLLAETDAGYDLVARPAEKDGEVRRRTNALMRAKPLKKPAGVANPVPVDRTAKQYSRSPEVQAFVRQEAEGQCELCREPAPFVDEAAVPFLEVHHVVPLADGGPDTVENAVALCPNCHRRLHHSGDRDQKLAQLYASVGRLRRVRAAGVRRS